MTSNLDSVGLPRALACAFAGGLLLAAQAVPAAAQDSYDDMTFEQKIIHQIMTGLGAGGGANINYHERSPLVIPPSQALPPPEDPNLVTSSVNWPRDPDLKARAKPVPPRLRGARNEQLKVDDSLPLMRSELDKPGASRTAGRVTSPLPDSNQHDRRLSPSELGYKGGIFGSLFGRQEPEAKFTGEPPRASLTDPPVGYQTPSPNQPYRVEDKGWFPRALNPFDRGTGTDGF